MSLVKTLGRVAFGLIVAQASKKLLGGRGGVLGGLLGAVLGGGATRNTAIAGGIGALLSSLLAGKAAQASSSSSSSNSSSGNILGSLFSMLGGSSQTKNTDIGSIFKAALNNELVQTTPEDEKNAAILLRAMISAVKADGVIDEHEQAKIKEHLKDASQADIDFVTTELRKPLDLQGLLQSVPQGMEKQVYLMSLLAMTLDDPREVKYMQDLAAGLNISVAERNHMHDQLNIKHLA